MRVRFKISVASLIYQCYMSPHCSGVSLVIRQLDNSQVFCLSFFGSVCSRSLQFSFTSCRSTARHHEHLLCLISCFIWSLRSDVTFVLAVSSALGLYCTSPPVRLLEKVVRYCVNKQTKISEVPPRLVDPTKFSRKTTAQKGTTHTPHFKLMRQISASAYILL